MNTEEIDKRDAVINTFRRQENEEMDMTDNINADSIEIISNKYDIIIGAISKFLQHNWEIIKNGVLNKNKLKFNNQNKNKVISLSLLEDCSRNAQGN